MTTLYLCEKPSQARDIARVLGVGSKEKGYIEGGDTVVTWCLGHLLTLAPPEQYCDQLKPWRIDVLPVMPNEWHCLPNAKTKSQLTIVKGLLKKADCVVIATDADREGDVIGREILDYYQYQGKVKRLWLSALDETSIKKALASIHPGESTYPLYQAGLGRQRADWLIGMNMTMATTCLFGAPGQGVLSVGRVQTPTLNLIVERDKRIEHFKPVAYFELDGVFTSEQGECIARWQAPDEMTDEEGHCLKSDIIESIVQKVKGKTGVVSLFDDTPRKTAPTVCYSLSSLQKMASSSLALSAKQTLEVAQSLYEKHKAITYPRTDSGYLPVNQFDEADAILSALVSIDVTLQSYVALCDTTFKSPVWNDKKVTAHHGMIPTQNSAVDITTMSEHERAVYDLIRRQYIAQFLGFYEYAQRKVEIKCENETFAASSNTPTALGWKQVLKQQEKKEEGDEQQLSSIPEFTVNQSVTVKDTRCLSKQTKPPARFTEGSLITAMKNIAKYVEEDQHKKTLKDTAGIGTEATRADIIEKLVNRDYIKRDKKHLLSTDRGRELVSILPDQIKNPVTTASWEQELDDIAQGQGRLNDFLLDQADVLEFMLEDLSDIRQRRGKGIDAGEQYPCPKCKSPLVRRKSKHGAFWSCSRYPDCNGLMADNRGKPKAKVQSEVSDIDCPTCEEGKLVRRKGKKGYWWGCNQYPNCKATYFDQKGKPDLSTKKQNKE